MKYEELQFNKPMSDDYCLVGSPDSKHEGVTIKITAHVTHNCGLL